MKIGIDLGGTFIKGGLVSNGKILKKISIPTEVSKGKERIIRNVIKCIAELDGRNVEGVGIGCPGSIDHKSGIVLSSTNLPIANVDFPKIIKKKFSLPVNIDNDANCFSLGEFRHGAGKRSGNLVGITLGTGIGSGIIINGEIYRGRNLAAELGHTTIKYDGELCNCGKKGHLEAYIGTKGVQKRFGRKISPEEIYNLANKGNKKAINVWKETGYYLGIGVTNLIHSFDPDIVVIGGNVAKAWKFFSKSMFETVRKQSLMPKTPIVRAKLEDAGVIGAGELLNEWFI